MEQSPLMVHWMCFRRCWFWIRT